MLVRAAAYLPTGTFSGRRVAGPDEDPFTMIATALERVRDPIPSAAGPTTLEILTELPEAYDPGLGAVLGGEVRCVRSGGPAPPPGPSVHLVVAAEGPDPPVADRSDPGPGDGAVALLYRPTSEAAGGETPERLRSGPHAVRRAFVFYREDPGAEQIEWAGDWSADPANGRPVDPGPAAAYRNLPPGGISQGAYVPRPRYLEGLASHWRFEGERCPRCATVTFPARGVCRNCGRREGLVPVTLPRDDLEVVATTTIGAGGQPTEFDREVEAFGPYEVVLAELAPGVRVTLPVSDAAAGSVRIGDRVDTRLRRLYPMDGEWRYGRKAVPRSPG